MEIVKIKLDEKKKKRERAGIESSFCTSWTPLLGKLVSLSLGLLTSTGSTGGTYLRALRGALGQGTRGHVLLLACCPILTGCEYAFILSSSLLFRNPFHYEKFHHSFVLWQIVLPTKEGWENLKTARYSDSWLCLSYVISGLPQVAQTVKNLPAMLENQVRSLGQEDPLKKGMATHSSILAWRIPLIEEPGRLQSIGFQTVRHDWSDLACMHI